MWGVAALLLIAFTLILFSRIARTRGMGLVFILLGMGVCTVVAFHTVHTLKKEDVLFAIMPLPLLSSTIADLIAIPILRRRVMPPCVRVKRHQNRIADIILILASFLSIAFLIFLLFTKGLSSFGWMIFLGLTTVTVIIALIPLLFEKIEICGNGVWQGGRFLPWEEFKSFSWQWKTKDSVELRLVYTLWIWPTRLEVLREDREAVHQLLAANLPDVSK